MKINRKLRRNTIYNTKTKIRNNSKGITIIALIVTIIVLLILTGISISMIAGNQGILTQAHKGKTETKLANAMEELKLEVSKIQIEKNGTATLQNVADEPCKGTKTSCLTHVTIDEDYNITSLMWKNTGVGNNPDGTQANIGVYGGEFSW